MKNKKRIAIMALVLASAMFAACGNSVETGNAIETKEGSVAVEATEEESALSETEDSTEEEDVAIEETEIAVGLEGPTETESEESTPIREVDAKMARFIEVAKGYGAERMSVQYQDSSVPQPEGIEVSSGTGLLDGFWDKEAIGAVKANVLLESGEEETEEDQDVGASVQGNGTSWQPIEGELRLGYVEFESTEVAASAFQKISEGYSMWNSNWGWKELEVTDTSQTHYFGWYYYTYQLYEDTVYVVDYSVEGDKERAIQIIEELEQY